MGLELFQRLTVDQVARVLELHPFEVVRILVADGALPVDLRLDHADIDRVRARGGLETWWDGTPISPVGSETPQRALVRALLRQLIARGVVEPNTTRADNLFRGADVPRQTTLRRAVNALIREGQLASRMCATGLLISIRPGALADVRAFAEDGKGPVDRLWDQA